MNIYKLRWLFYFFAYRLNRWLGSITKWERRDAQAVSKLSWEYCMFLNSTRKLKQALGEKFAMTLKEGVDVLKKACRMKTISKSINDNFGNIAKSIRKPNIFGRFEKFWKEARNLNKEEK